MSRWGRDHGESLDGATVSPPEVAERQPYGSGLTRLPPSLRLSAVKGQCTEDKKRAATAIVRGVFIRRAFRVAGRIVEEERATVATIRFCTLSRLG